MVLRRLDVEVAVAAALLTVMAWYSGRSACFYSMTSVHFVISGILSTVCLALSLVCIWALCHRPAPHQSLQEFSAFLAVKMVGRLAGKIWMRRLRASWKTPRQHQERTLLGILKENGDTQYGRQHGFRDIASLEEFRRRHPLTTYEDYRPYVERMMAGEENIMVARTPACYVRTTGTTGKQKTIPYTAAKDGEIILVMCILDFNVFAHFPSIGLLQKRLTLYVHPNVTQTETGVNIQTIGTRTGSSSFGVCDYPTPPAGFRIQTNYEANYVHFLFALRDPGVGSIHVLFLSQLYHALLQLERCWMDIVRDIQEGALNMELELTPDVRRELTRALGRGDPERASELRKEFGKGMNGILKRVWPRLAVIIAPDNTGIWPTLAETFAKGLTLVPDFFGCSEGFFAPYLGTRVAATAGYHFIPSEHVLEFIKLEEVHLDQPRTYFLDELEVDQCYEVVLTQPWSGLYRYRFGDIIRIVGFTEKCPVFEFMYRMGQMLNLFHEKLDQRVVEESVRAAVARWTDGRLVEFSIAESTLIPDHRAEYDKENVCPYYLVFLEIHVDESVREALPEKASSLIDEELQLRNIAYKQLREEGRISHPRVALVREGAFDALRDHVLATTGGTAVQYKVPRKLRSLVNLKLLQEYAA